MRTGRYQRNQRIRAGLMVVALAASGLAWMVARGGPASADVTATSGSAFGASVNLLGNPILPPTPTVAGGPAIGYPAVSQTVLPIAVPQPPVCPIGPGPLGVGTNVPVGNILEVCAITVSTFGQVGATPHLHSANSVANIAGVAVGSGPFPLLTLEAIDVACRADGDDATSTVNVVGGTLGQGPLGQAGSVAPNTVIEVPGVIRIVLHEIVSNTETFGTNQIAVNGAHISVLGVGPGAGADIILGHVECSATGPDVNAGNLVVAKQAPGDAAGVLFTFTITCPGTPGSPFTRTVTGSGTTPVVQNIPEGTVCTVAETPVAGFVDQPPQTAPAIVSGQTTTVTFTNTRVAGTGSVVINKNSPADAAGVTFTFTIFCPGTPGSPFTRTVTGSGATAPVTGVPAGTVCTAVESPTAGFVDQASQNFPPAVADQTRTVTFNNVRVAADTGSVAVIKNAPADAQGVTFTFTITCPGVAGSPFTRTVTGSGTSTAVTGIPVGTVCTVSEAPVAGFVDVPAQNFPAVVANQTQTVTVVNQRVAPNTGSVAVVKNAPADAQGVTFTFTISCPGVAGSPFTRTVTGSGTSVAVSGLPVGTVCTVAETPLAGFVDQQAATFAPVVAGQTQTVAFTNVRTPPPPPGTGSIFVVKLAPADAQGLTFTFTISCPGVAGSPFIRQVTGSATAIAVTGIPAGAVCTVSETPTFGFFDQPNQTFTVGAGTTVTVTFVNTRVPPPPPPPPPPVPDQDIVINNNNTNNNSNNNFNNNVNDVFVEGDVINIDAG